MVIVTSFLHLSLIKPQQRWREWSCQEIGQDLGVSNQMEEHFDTFSYPLGQHQTIFFTFSYLVLVIYAICWESRDLFRLNGLYRSFWSSVLKPTEPLDWASGFKGRVRLARNMLTNALMVLPYLTFQSRVQAHIHNRAFILKHSWHMY